MNTRNITKRRNTYYADFINSQGKRIRKSLGKDLTQAKIKVLQLMTNTETQAEVKGAPIPLSDKFLHAYCSDVGVDSP